MSTLAVPPSEPFTPPAGKALTVRIMDTTAHIKVPTAPFMEPEMAGFTHMECNAYTFVIEHPSGRKLLFDLGVRKDWQNMAPAVVDRIKTNKFEVDVKKSVIEILEENGYKGDQFEAIIWSHWHWDHNGDPSTFPPTTALIVGPGFTKAFVPGYPSNPTSPINESDYQGRELREITFTEPNAVPTPIGHFRALDYFGDGSFYILDSPGHAIGHICGLARTTAAPDDSFILMGGDFAHHGGEFRPSPLLPIPPEISPNPIPDIVVADDDVGAGAAAACPGHVFEALQTARGRRPDLPFFSISRNEKSIAHDPDETERTIGKVMAWDWRHNILVVFAHDKSLLPFLELFPADANGWMGKGWARKGKWAFVKDFRTALLRLR